MHTINTSLVAKVVELEQGKKYI